MKRTIKDILKLFPSTTKADWVQHKNGGGWRQTTATVDDSAFVEGIVSGNSRVFGNAQVSGDARVSGNSQVYGDARIYGNSRVYGNSWVSGNSQVFGDARVYGDAQVFGDAWVYGNARVYGNAWVSGNAWKESPLYIQGTRPAATNCKRGSIAIGCEIHTFAKWQRDYEKIFKAKGYTAEQIAEYKKIIDFIVENGK